MIKRLLCVLLLTVMVLSVLAGCKKNGSETPGTSGNGENTESTTDPGTTEPETPAKTWDDLPKDKYNTEFTILGQNAFPWSSEDINPPEGSTTELSVAAYSRNTAVETRHGITINVNMFNGNAITVMDTMNLVDTNDYSIYDVPLSKWAAVVVKGYFEDLRRMDELDLADSWWDQRFIEDLTIYDQLYGILSDATYVDKMSTWAVQFNKDMFTTYGIEENMYQLVENGEWTIAKLTELAKKVNVDANSDGQMELGGQDIYGIAGELANLDFFFEGCGLPYASFADDEIVYHLTEKKSTFDDVFQKVFDLVADSTLTYMADAHMDAQEGPWGRGRKFFEQQQALFYVGGIINLPTYFRSFEHDYGVVPMPKYTAEQDRYYNAITTTNCLTFSIPKNAPDSSMAAVIMQALACRGETTIVPVFYNVLLKGQSARDPQTWKMLDSIFDNRSFDLGTIYRFGNLAGSSDALISQLVKDGKRNEFSSTVDQNKNVANAKIEELMKFYDKNYAQE